MPGTMTRLFSDTAADSARPIMVTGASGFVGWNAARYFAGRRHDVVATYRNLPHYLHNVDGVRAVRLDVLDDTSVAEVVARFQPCCVLHFAALARPQRDRDPRDLHRTNVEGTARLALRLAEHDIPIVYLSSDLVYPSNTPLATSETPVAPTGVYGQSKYEGELAVRELARRWVILRPSLMYGQGTPRSNSFTQFLEARWRSDSPAPVFVDQFRPFLFVNDLVDAVDRVLAHTEAWNTVHLCGGPERLSRYEFAVRYARLLGISTRLIAPMQASELAGYSGGASNIDLDSSSLHRLGWRPRRLEEVYRQAQALPVNWMDDGQQHETGR